MRQGFGLTANKTDMRDISGNNQIAHELDAAYPSGVNTCSSWICGLAEPAVDGGELGELFSTVIADQFQWFMDGDRIDPNVRDLSLINFGINVDTVTLADVINANTVPGAIGPDAMLA
jgi:hypothetical protein